MRIRPSFALAASLILLAGPAAQARPFCDRFPDAPICNGDDPIDPCEIDPSSCEPDPCEADPASCEPDPCEADPASCEPDPCEVDPASCEPEPEQEVYSHLANLEGFVIVKGKGFKERKASEFSLFLNESRFELVVEKPISFRGTLVAKNAKATRFQLFLDDEAIDAFRDFVIGEASAAGARAGQRAKADSSKLILKFRADGTAALKIQSDVLANGSIEVHFKANLAGAVEAAQQS